MKVTILGCGTSAGVPMIGCDCAVCRSTDPRNKRRRASILIEAKGRTILFDTGPDLRLQCLDAQIMRIDAIVFTHAHADHVHGIDDVRSFNQSMGVTIPVYGHADVLAKIRERFDYAFHPPHPTNGFWRPSMHAHGFTSGAFRIGEVELVPFMQGHGRGQAWGFRIGSFAYSTDADHLDDAAFAALAGIEVWLVDALRDRPHSSHAHLERTLGWIDRVRPRLALLTHMNHEVDYADWAARLPAGVAPACDGQVIELED